MQRPMKRRNFLVTAGLVGVTSLTKTARSGYAETQATKRPNILVVLADDLAFRGVGFNNPLVKTPHLDRLAHEGLILDRAYVASPICVASRASLMTGLFPQQHASVGLDATGFRGCVVEQKRFKTFAHYLGSAGYTTAFCGKSHLGPPKEYGFELGQEHGDGSDDASFAFASSFLSERPKDSPPFLLWLAARQPHVPLLPSQEWLDVYKDAALQVDPNFSESPPEGSIYNQGLPGQRYYRDSEYTKQYKDLPSGPPRSKEVMLEFIRAYYATISRLDSQIGGLVEQLKKCGHYDNTVIVFLADNGYHLGNHGLGNKITMHEESVRIPMFVHAPNRIKPSVRSRALVSSTDLFPTLLDLAGVAPPDYLPGKSLVPIFGKPVASVRDYVFSECVGVGGKPGMGHRMARTDRWKYVLTDSNDEALFDEAADPYELTNVVADDANKEILMTLRSKLKEWMVLVGDTHVPPQ
jgi:arylsulfatase A-like enzyme